VTVPLALLGACALMWVFGYTLDNLFIDGVDDRTDFLGALTRAIGFASSTYTRDVPASRWRASTTKPTAIVNAINERLSRV